MLSWSEIESRAVAFQKTWKNSPGDERQDAQTFEKDFMHVFGIDWHDGLHEYQLTLRDGSIGYIDYFLPGKILIEMKSKGKSLAKAYTQAMSYVHALKPEEVPVLVITCDFNTMNVYNLKKDHPYKPFKVTQLKQHVRIFGLLAGYGVDSEEKTEIEVNTDASYKMAKIHDELKENGYEGHDLEVYLVRLLFCLFADDTGIFEKESFKKFLIESKEDGSDLSMRIMMLFSILDTPHEKRMKNLSADLKRFRYINGSIFKEPLPPASFTDKMRQALIECCDFDWTQISPSIFGAMFQGVMDQKERRALGAHYTSEENILKVINPLFLDDLYDEFELSKNTKAELEAFHDKIASLKFLDPACGSGNFLIVTYKKIRELEFEILKLLYDNRQMTLIDTMTKVKIDQFFGIEYEEFPCQTAQVSMILMKHLMDQEVSNYFGMNLIDFPIKENANIVHKNALRIDWNDVIPVNELNYIIGNPPFIGTTYQSKEQKEDIHLVFSDVTKLGNLDYVSCWYKKAAEYIKNTKIRCAFVSTNSICQGEQVGTLWKPVLSLGTEIIFAYKTFVWNNEAKGKAAVHCVIIGFQNGIYNGKKYIFDNDIRIEAMSINPYLIDAPNIIIYPEQNSICSMPLMKKGNQATDGGNLILDEQEIEELIRKEPLAKKYIKKFIGSREYLHNEKRYCLWLVNCPIQDLKKMPSVVERVQKVKHIRENSKDPGAHRLALRPMEFRETNNPKTAIVIPLTSSENRRYIPIGFVDNSIIISNALGFIPNGNLYQFGILSSNAHNAWMRTVAGRLKSDYRYSKDIVYNTFPWPEENEKHKKAIEKTAMGILDARNAHPDDCLADLYDPLFMPLDLLKAHQANDRAVWEAYDKAWSISSEEECVAHIMKLYQELTKDI